jgi:hypothetical protein
MDLNFLRPGQAILGPDIVRDASQDLPTKFDPLANLMVDLRQRNKWHWEVRHLTSFCSCERPLVSLVALLGLNQLDDNRATSPQPASPA